MERQDVGGEEADVGPSRWRLLTDGVLLSVQQVHQAVLQAAQPLSHIHTPFKPVKTSQLPFYLPIVTLQQQQVRGLVERVPHPSSALTALLFSETVRGLALSAPNGSWQRGVKTLGLVSHSQLQRQAFEFTFPINILKMASLKGERHP